MMTSTERTGRAKPMPTEERRAAIARATLPLLTAHGRDFTTRQIAEAAGVAEGTLFRVFDDKEAIIDAAVEQFLDPEPFREALRRIDPSLPLDVKIELVLDRFLDRFTGMFGVFAALGTRPKPPEPASADILVGIFEDLLAPDLQALRVPPEQVFLYVRLIAFASAMPHFRPTTGLDSDQLAHLVMHGIIGEPIAAREASVDPHSSDTRTDEGRTAPCS